MAVFLGDFEYRADLNQLSRSDTRAVPRSRFPGAPALDKFRPKRKGPALSRFGRMNAAAVFEEEMTLRATRLAKTKQSASAVNVPRLEFGRSEADEFRGALQVIFVRYTYPC